MPILYDQSEYEMAGALRQKPYPFFNSPYSGLDIPWGSEIVIEGHVKSRVREIEGPCGEFRGHYSGGRTMLALVMLCASYRKHPILDSLSTGMPWTALDYMLA